jgi:hypothetical protein
MLSPVIIEIIHPGEELLLAYCIGSTDSVEIMEAHLNDCAQCCRKVVELVRELVQLGRRE